MKYLLLSSALILAGCVPVVERTWVVGNCREHSCTIYRTDCAHAHQNLSGSYITQNGITYKYECVSNLPL